MRVFTSVTARQEHLRRSLPTSLPLLNLTWLTLLLHLSVPLAWMSTLTHEHTHTTLSRPPHCVLFRTSLFPSSSAFCRARALHAPTRKAMRAHEDAISMRPLLLLPLCLCSCTYVSVIEGG